jgi:hypothetical protein
VKYSKARNDKVRFNKIRQENEVRREKIKKKVSLGNVTGEISFN